MPFILGTTSFGLIVISIFIFIGNRIGETQIAKILASTGQMTLTHYISHLILGLLLFPKLPGQTLSYDLLKEIPTDPIIILIFAITYFLLSCTFSYLWTKKYKNGPFEMLMRRISGWLTWIFYKWLLRSIYNQLQLPVKYKRSAGFRSNSLSAHHKVS